ncbi:HEAT repeat domain-containing protein [Candidatus Viridilinea mediisalina]|nr:HEAT repeat domain-containing protein [Candidatus Viridilinea mediisalina]
MLSLSQLPFLPRKRVAQRYRTRLRAQLAHEPVSQLLKQLLDLPLGLAPLPDAAAIRATQNSLALYGPPASGRSLALMQTLVHWAQSNDDAPTLYVPLQEMDVATRSPYDVLAALMNHVGLPSSYANGKHPGVLLFDNWELLPPVRREIWQQFLHTTAVHWPALRFVIALPPDEAWPLLDTLHSSKPVTTAVAVLLAHLLPEHATNVSLADLVTLPGFDPQPSLADLALMALTYPLGGLPSSRAQLYAHAFALIQPLIEEQRLLAQADPSETQPNVRSRLYWTGLTIGRALLRHYRLARGFAGGEALEALADLPLHDQVAVAPLTLGLLQDPCALQDLLWQRGPEELQLRVLVACTRAYPDYAPEYGLRLVEYLLDPNLPASTRSLLHELVPVLPALLAAASHVDELRSLALLNDVVRVLPHSRQLWLSLIDHPQTTAGLRWTVVDSLVLAPSELMQLQAVPVNADALALAARAYLAAVGGGEARALLAKQPLRRAIEHLLADQTAGERRSAVAALLLADVRLPAELRALAVVVVDSLPMVEQAVYDADPLVRQAALAVLAHAKPAVALAAFGRMLAQPDDDVARQRALLDALASIAHQGGTALLLRATVANQLPLDLCLQALDHVAARSSGDALVLRRLLATTELPGALRAAVAWQLGRKGIVAALPELAHLLCGPTAPLLRRAVAGALGELAQRPTCCDAAAEALVAGLRRKASDPRLGEIIIAALGQSGAPVALAALRAMLSPRMIPLLREAWLRAVPSLNDNPGSVWPQLDLPEHVQIKLFDALAEGQTLADPPSCLDELAERHAIRLACAAAAALVQLGAVVQLHEPVLAMVRQALADELRHEVARALLHALGHLSDPGCELDRLLANPDLRLELHWLALEILGSDQRSRDVLRERLALGADEPLLQIQLVDVLAHHSDTMALPLFRQLARDPVGDLQLRMAAVRALARLADTESYALLVVIAADEDAPVTLRHSAATLLPPTLNAEAEVTLRQALRAERMAPLLKTALQCALARAGDSTALGYLLRTIQSEDSVEAIACIEELAELHDQNSTPLLVRVSQSPTTPPNVRLAAVIALLQLEGSAYLTLLYEYLEASIPPLRFQAYTALAALHPDDPRLSDPLTNMSDPLALRLQMLQHVGRTNPDAPIVAQLVAANDEADQLRLAAAVILREASSAEAITSLATVLASESNAALLLRWHCVVSLGAIAHSKRPNSQTARAWLASQALAPEQHPLHRHWAAELLVHDRKVL